MPAIIEILLWEIIPERRLWRPKFLQNEGDGASRFTALITDMAMVTCFVWRATRHVSDGTL